MMTNKTKETLLEEVIDREEIRNLPIRYCHCVWQRDIEGYLNLFTDDGELSTNDPALPGAQGREGLRRNILQTLDTMKPRPFIHNHVVELITSERATGTCYLELHFLNDGRPWTMTGWLNDEYTKIGGQWKFKSRRISIDSSVPVNKT